MTELNYITKYYVEYTITNTKQYLNRQNKDKYNGNTSQSKFKITTIVLLGYLNKTNKGPKCITLFLKPDCQVLLNRWH